MNPTKQQIAEAVAYLETIAKCTWSGHKDCIVTVLTALDAAEKQNAVLEKERDEGKREALRLAEVIYRRHYRVGAPNWKPLDYTAGIISQIDNMVAGILERDEAAEAKLTSINAELHNIRPFADCYKRICQSLNIENDILGFVASLQAKLDAATKDAERNWQPIETAPRNGEILASGANYGDPKQGYHIVLTYHDGCGWRTPNEEDEGYYDHLTHWMSIPSAPDAARKSP